MPSPLSAIGEGPSLVPQNLDTMHIDDAAVQHICSTPKADSSAVTCGNVDWSDVKLRETGTVRCLAKSDEAQAALKAGGAVVAWGNANEGGDCSEVQKQLYVSTIGDGPSLASQLLVEAQVEDAQCRSQSQSLTLCL